MTKHKPASITTQTEPRLDPTAKLGDKRHDYYLLEPLHSPPIIPPNAADWEAYPKPRGYIQGDNPEDDRRAYGAAVYSRPLTWQELDDYNMLPMDYNEAVLYDLFTLFGKDKPKMLRFLNSFFRTIKADPGLRRLALAIKLFSRGETLESLEDQMESVIISGEADGEK